jgi:hypothetical protein
MASWSVRYGITDEHTPTPIPHASQTGWVKAGTPSLTRPDGLARPLCAPKKPSE